jgi:NadR type nicotinamide-nucleotide adenylyltransferase
VEKGLSGTMNHHILKIVITGPESTGKSTLSEQLAKHFNTIFVPEYARDYITQLDRSYVFEDVEYIARKQVEEVKEFECQANRILFLDTYLIITKVWFEEVYQQCPVWLHKAIKESDIDLFLLCKTDLPWIQDNVRENGGKKREYLFQVYVDELRYYGFPYRMVEGFNETRLKNAISIIDELL